MIIGVRFRPSGRVHYCDDAGIAVSFGDRVAIETEDGEREASVVIGSDQTLYSDLKGPLPPMIRVSERAGDTASGALVRLSTPDQ